jgi:ketosteroid isomerase-like protein
VIEWLWVTDNERIEQVVYDLRRAVANSDVEGVLAHMAPNVQYVRGDTALSGEATRALIRDNLSQARFDFIRISHLETNAGQQSRRGTAGFRVFAKGTLHLTQATMNIGTADSVWSLGFQETAPGVWKVNRITPVQIPNGALLVFGSGSSDRSRVSFSGEESGRPRPVGRSRFFRRPGAPGLRDADLAH